MEVQPDFRGLLELFNAHRVEYVIVGGYALAFMGRHGTLETWTSSSGRMLTTLRVNTQGPEEPIFPCNLFIK